MEQGSRPAGVKSITGEQAPHSHSTNSGASGERRFEMDIKADQVLDCTGMVCPEPILKTNMTVKKMEVGKVLEMIGTDLGSKNDIVAWAKRTGNELLGTEDREGATHYFIKKLK